MMTKSIVPACAFAIVAGVAPGADAFGADDSRAAKEGASAEHDIAPVPNASTRVAAAEAALTRRGYLVGAVDGILDPTSYAGLLGFQRDQGLALTGRVDRATAEALDLGS